MSLHLSSPINKRITAVHYYHINDLNHPFLFRGYHCFDLAINIAFDDDSNLHIGWSNNDRQELHFTKFNTDQLQQEFIRKDAFREWSHYIGRSIDKIEVQYVTEKWNIPESCTIQFENGTFITLALSKEVATPSTLPKTLQYDDASLIYVFLNRKPPPIIPVRITPPEFLSTAPNKTRELNLSENKRLGFFLVLFCLILCAIRYIMTKVL